MLTANVFKDKFLYFNLLEFEEIKRDGNSTDIKSREIVFVQNRTESVIHLVMELLTIVQKIARRYNSHLCLWL